MREFRRLLLVHEGRDWGRAVQPLLEGDEDLFPYDYVHHEGTQLVMNVPEGWEYDEVVSEDGTMRWFRRTVRCCGVGTIISTSGSQPWRW